jgi:hypothetical protein
VADIGAISTDILDFLARVVVTLRTPLIVLEELSGVSEPPMIIGMTTTSARSNAMTIGSGTSSNAPGT